MKPLILFFLLAAVIGTASAEFHAASEYASPGIGEFRSTNFSFAPGRCCHFMLRMLKHCLVCRYDSYEWSGRRTG